MKTTAVGAAAALCIVLALAPTLSAQSATPTPTPNPTPNPSPGSTTPGSTPIEATLFAYRALASDVAAVAFEIKNLGSDQKVVVGTAADLAPIIQWHGVIAEALTLHDRAEKILAEFNRVKQDLTPKLKIDKVQSGSGANLTFTLTVSNPSAGSIGSDAFPVVVTDALPPGWTLSALGSHDGWDCATSPNNVTCSRTDALDSDQSYPSISLQVVTNGLGRNIAKVSYAGRLVQSSAVGPGAVSGQNFFLADVGTATTDISNVATLAGNLAGLFAVTETPTAAQVVPSDAALINLVTRHLRHEGIDAYVPSVYSPNLLRNVGLDDTKIGQALKTLEADRIQLLQVQNLAQALSAKPPPPADPPAAARVIALGSAAQTLISSIDSLENGLFGGQVLTEAGAPKGSGGGNTSCPPCPAGATTCVIVCPQSAATDSSAKTQTPAPSPSPAPSSVLQQILGADLTIQQACNSTSCDDVEFLSVRALEAGGGQVKKSRKLIGDRLYYSGGAVMTFSLSRISGYIACSGIAYNYEGNIREKNYERALRAPQLPAIVTTEFPCGNPASGGSASRVSEDATAAPPELAWAPGLVGVRKGMSLKNFPDGLCHPNPGDNDADGDFHCSDITGKVIATVQFHHGHVTEVRFPEEVLDVDGIDALRKLARVEPMCSASSCQAGPYEFRLTKTRKTEPKPPPKSPCIADVCPGMTIAQVVSLKGAAYRAFAAKGDITVYEFTSVRVWFRKGKVFRVGPPQ